MIYLLTFSYSLFKSKNCWNVLFTNGFSPHYFINIFNNFIYLFTFGFMGLHCFEGFSLVAASWGYSSFPGAGFSLWCLLLLRSLGSRHAGLSSRGSWALEHWLSDYGAQAQLFHGVWGHVGSPGPGIKAVSPALPFFTNWAIRASGTVDNASDYRSEDSRLYLWLWLITMKGGDKVSRAKTCEGRVQAQALSCPFQCICAGGTYLSQQWCVTAPMDGCQPGNLTRAIMFRDLGVLVR